MAAKPKTTLKGSYQAQEGYWLPESFHLHLTALEAEALFDILSQYQPPPFPLMVRVKGRKGEVPIQELLLEKMERARKEMVRTGRSPRGANPASQRPSEVLEQQRAERDLAIKASLDRPKAAGGSKSPGQTSRKAKPSPRRQGRQGALGASPAPHRDQAVIRFVTESGEYICDCTFSGEQWRGFKQAARREHKTIRDWLKQALERGLGEMESREQALKNLVKQGEDLGLPY